MGFFSSERYNYKKVITVTSQFKNRFDADRLSDQTRQLAKSTYRYGGVLSLVTSFLLLGLVIYGFLIAWKARFPWYVGAVLILLALIRLFVGILAWVKMAAFDSSVPEAPQGGGAGKLAHSVQRVAEGRSRYKMYRALEFSLLLMGLGLFSFFLNIPWMLGAFFLLIALVVPFIQMVEVRRIASVDVTKVDTGRGGPLALEADEILLDRIPGILRYGIKSGGYEVMGKGKASTPENALLITNKAIWVLTVPLPGSGQIVAGTDISVWQWQTAYEDIRKGLESLVASLPLDQVLQQNRGKRLMGWGEIRSVEGKTQRLALILVGEDGKKYSYAFRQTEDFEKVKRIFGLS